MSNLLPAASSLPASADTADGAQEAVANFQSAALARAQLVQPATLPDQPSAYLHYAAVLADPATARTS